jgi:hypothetical protein
MADELFKLFLGEGLDPEVMEGMRHFRINPLEGIISTGTGTGTGATTPDGDGDGDDDSEERERERTVTAADYSGEEEEIDGDEEEEEEDGGDDDGRRGEQSSVLQVFEIAPEPSSASSTTSLSTVPYR